MYHFKKTLAFVLTLAMIITTLAGLGMTSVSAEETVVAAGGTVVPAGTTTYDFTQLTDTTLAAGTDGFDGFSGTVSAAASSSKSYVQIKKGSTDALTFVVGGTWSASFSSSHSNNAKGTVITGPDGTTYSTTSSDEALELTDMAAGTYTITASEKNHCYLSTAVFTVESNDPPTAVTNLTATAGNARVSLSWTASEGATSYEITANGETETTDDTSYIVTGLENGTAYTFSVVAVNAVGKSDAVTVSATPQEPTDPPGAFTLSAEGSDKAAVLIWTESEYVSSYDVYQNGSIIASDITANTYTATGLTNDTEYTFSVTAKNKNGSTSSGEVKVTPTEPPASQITVTKTVGDIETAAVEWTNPTAVDKYNVYVKSVGGTYTKIDDELVRYYGSYYRADAMGLAAGSYIIKIAAVVGGSETDYVETDAITVEAAIREGFAFDPQSSHYDSTGVGAYKMDGTLKDNAQVLYIDNTNKDTVKFTVDIKGKANEGTGLVEILKLREKNGAETTPLVIRMIGQVEAPSGTNSSGYVQLKACENITFEGVGNDATTYHWSFLLREAVNCEVKNLAVMEFYDDGISLDTDNYNCWIHNCDIFYGEDRGGDQKKGDGSLDVKSGSDYCTFSYNHFWDSGKCSLCGMKSDAYQGYHMTYYGNWFDHSDSRMPRVRGDQVHVYNNYYDGNSKYGVGSTTGSSVFVENNVFRNVKYPILTSQQGSDVAGENEGTFSGEDGGVVKAYGNLIYEGSQSHAIVSYQEDNTEFDAYMATSKDETVPSTVTAKKGGGTYSNFDTASTMYSYNALDTDKVVDAVQKWAGRVEGGDFTYDFDDSTEDSDYERISALGDALASYETTLLYSYTSAGTYPATNGTLPTSKPTTEPFTQTPSPTTDPSQPTAAPSYAYPTTWDFGEAPFTVTEGDTTHPDTAYFPQGTTQDSKGNYKYNVTSSSITADNFSGLSFKTSATLEDQYQAGSKTFADGYKSSWQIKTKSAGSASDKCFSFTPVADGTVTVYATNGSSTKTATLTIAQGSNKVEEAVSYTADSSGTFPVFSLAVTAGEAVKIYSADGNMSVFCIKYEASGEVTTPAPTTVPTATPVTTPAATAEPFDAAYTITSAQIDASGKLSVALAASKPADSAKLIVAEYDTAKTLVNMQQYDVSGTTISGLDYTVTASTDTVKVMLWDSLTSMIPLAEPVEATVDGGAVVTTAPATATPETTVTAAPATAAPVGEATVWTFTDLPEGTKTTSSAGDEYEYIISTTEYQGLTLVANGELNTTTNKYKNAFEIDRTTSVEYSDGTTTTGGLKFGGASASDARIIKYTPTSDGTFTVYVKCGSNTPTNTRTLTITQGSKTATAATSASALTGIATLDVTAGTEISVTVDANVMASKIVFTPSGGSTPTVTTAPSNTEAPATAAPVATEGPTVEPGNDTPTVTVGSGFEMSADSLTIGTYTSNIEYNGVTIGADDSTETSSDGTVKNAGSIDIDASTSAVKFSDGTSYTQRIKTGGPGDPTTGVRCISFVPDTACTMTIAMVSSNGTASRNVVVQIGDTTQTITVPGSKTSKDRYTISGIPANTKVMIYSTDGGINICDLKLTTGSSSGGTTTTTPAPAATADPSATKDPSITEALYNFSEIEDGIVLKKGDVSVFDGAMTISVTGSTDSGVIVAAPTSSADDGTTFTGGLKAKGLTVKIPLKIGETVTVYYCGTDSNAAAIKGLTMKIYNSSGAECATESNDEQGGKIFKPYTISYTAATEDTYTIYDSDLKNRTIVYGVKVN